MIPDIQIIGKQTPVGTLAGSHAPIPTDLYIRFNMEVALIIQYHNCMIASHNCMIASIHNAPPRKDHFAFTLHAAEYNAWYSLWDAMWIQHRETRREHALLMNLLDSEPYIPSYASHTKNNTIRVQRTR